MRIMEQLGFFSALGVVIAVIAAAAFGRVMSVPAGLPAKEDFFDSKGVKIHYTDEGQGEPVLLIHGFTADIALNWRAPGVIKASGKELAGLAPDGQWVFLDIVTPDGTAPAGH